MIRRFNGVMPQVPNTAFVDVSAQVIGDVILGEHASVWMNAVVRGDVHHIRIGAHTNIQDNCVLHGFAGKWPVLVGDWVTVGHCVTLHGCVVEDHCLIGMNSVIMDGARIGAGSIIATGSIIAENTIVQPNSLWMGAPAQFCRRTTEREAQMIMEHASNYKEYKDAHLRELPEVADLIKTAGR